MPDILEPEVETTLISEHNNEISEMYEGDVSRVTQNSQNTTDTGLLRPYLNQRGLLCVSLETGQTDYVRDANAKVIVNAKGEPRTKKVRKPFLVSDLEARGIRSPIFNDSLALRKDEWLAIDRSVVKTARKRLKAWQDLRDANEYSLDGMSSMIFEHEAMSDPGQATVDMDGTTAGVNDSPVFQLQGLPLPFTHSGFHISKRKLNASRTKGTPLDTTLPEACARRVSETVEQTTIGSVSGIQYGVSTNYNNTSKVYGYINHPDRVTKTDCTAPTSSNGTTILADVLALREALYAVNMFGPFMLYVSTGYDAVLDNDLKSESDKTVRQRILEVDGIAGVRRLDYLSGNVLVLVQMDPMTARAVVGLDMITVRWESQGGMKQNFRTMCIYVPQIRADYSGNCGVGHGTTS